jgi:hypothetical protein
MKKVFVDLHNHFPKNVNLEKLLGILTSGKLTGITEREDLPGTLTYDEALKMCRQKAFVEEITPGLLARIFNGRSGYVVRAKEYCADFNHVLSLGAFLPDDKDAAYIINSVKEKENGLAILDHPYVLIAPSSCRHTKFRLIEHNSREEERLLGLFSLADEVEVFNAQNIDFLWFRMRVANEMAKGTAVKLGFKGVAGSDSHYRLDQVYSAGFYVDESDILGGLGALNEAIRGKKFEHGPENYVSTLSSIAGHVGSAFKEGIIGRILKG